MLTKLVVLVMTAWTDSNSMQVHRLWNKRILLAHTIRLRHRGKAGMSKIQ